MNFICKLLGITENASAHGLFIDHMLEVVHWFMLALFIGWSIFLVYCLWRFHASNNPKASYAGNKSKFSTHVEIGVVAIEAMLLMGFAFPIWAQRVARDQFPDVKTAVRVQAVAEQFGWNFHYPGPDNQFGRRALSLVSAANPVGLDPADPAGQDDFVAKNSMALPVNQPAIVYISSKDVIHNYNVKNFRIGQDAIPGMQVPVWFTPIKEGSYEIVCAQLCGSGHANMVGIVEVQPAADYQSWLKSKAPTVAPAPAAQASLSSPVAPKG
ncbi:MAG: cytochrome c oxidase subunit II [Candidatus Methylacidiphilales bacterium]|nr:cytochrome c oxidase subunit II [Candidatus Methylacidiphilales bacterium]